MKTKLSPSMYENLAWRRSRLTSLRSSSARRLRSNLRWPGIVYRVNRKVALPPRGEGELRSMSRTWYTVQSCSTTLPFFTSDAFMAFDFDVLGGNDVGIDYFGARRTAPSSRIVSPLR